RLIGGFRKTSAVEIGLHSAQVLVAPDRSTLLVIRPSSAKSWLRIALPKPKKRWWLGFCQIGTKVSSVSNPSSVPIPSPPLSSIPNHGRRGSTVTSLGRTTLSPGNGSGPADVVRTEIAQSAKT